ncbi:MAG: enoyl-CoA hydratase-related protein [Gordonia sp. (in: high G+C Gram-positive bacteria)]
MTGMQEEPGVGLRDDQCRSRRAGRGDHSVAAGADIKEMSEKTYSEVVSESFFGAWDDLARLRTPLIAAVTGFALGGGCELAMLCDILIAGENAVFGQPEINLGVIPGIGGFQRLTRAVGKAKAMDLILTGRQMKADEAHQCGLVSRLVPTEECLAIAKQVAATIAGKSSIAASLAKEAVNRAFEGMAAFVAKREPRFINS